eukprot:gene24973-10634_t
MEATRPHLATHIADFKRRKQARKKAVAGAGGACEPCSTPEPPAPSTSAASKCNLPYSLPVTWDAAAPAALDPPQTYDAHRLPPQAGGAVQLTRRKKWEMLMGGSAIQMTTLSAVQMGSGALQLTTRKKWEMLMGGEETQECSGEEYHAAQDITVDDVLGRANTFAAQDPLLPVSDVANVNSVKDPLPGTLGMPARISPVQDTAPARSTIPAEFMVVILVWLGLAIGLGPGGGLLGIQEATDGCQLWDIVLASFASVQSISLIQLLTNPGAVLLADPGSAFLGHPGPVLLGASLTVVVLPRLIKGAVRIVILPASIGLATWALISHPTESAALLLFLTDAIQQQPVLSSGIILLVATLLVAPYLLLGSVAMAVVISLYLYAAQYTPLPDLARLASQSAAQLQSVSKKLHWVPGVTDVAPLTKEQLRSTSREVVKEVQSTSHEFWEQAHSTSQEVVKQAHSKSQEVLKQAQSKSQAVLKRAQGKSREMVKEVQSTSQEVLKQAQRKSQEVVKEIQSKSEEALKQAHSPSQAVLKQAQSKSQEVVQEIQSTSQEVLKRAQSTSQEVLKQAQSKSQEFVTEVQSKSQEVLKQAQ